MDELLVFIGELLYMELEEIVGIRYYTDESATPYFLIQLESGKEISLQLTEHMRKVTQQI